MKQSDSFFSTKKIHVSFLLAIMIFAIHISSLSNYNLTTSLGSKILFCDSITMLIVNVAVPMFMILSAVMFYRNYSLEKTKDKYMSRVKTLVIPYLFWNFVWTMFQYICSYTFISNFFVGREKAQFSLCDLLQGIFFYKYSPFWFIFDLIVFVALCPFIYTLLRNKWIGAIVIVLAAITCESGYAFLEQVLFRRDVLVYYLIGAYVGIHFYDWFTRRKNQWISIGALITCIAIIFYYKQPGNMLSYSFVNLCIITLYCLAFWWAFDMFPNKNYFSFEKESFLIYAMHINVSAIIAKLIYLLLPKQDFIAPVNYILTMVLTVTFISVFAYIVDRFIPKFRILISGGR